MHTQPVINTQAFKNICNQKGLCFLIALKSQGDLRVRARDEGGEQGGGRGRRGRGRDSVSTKGSLVKVFSVSMGILLIYVKSA